MRWKLGPSAFAAGMPEPSLSPLSPVGLSTRNYAPLSVRAAASLGSAQPLPPQCSADCAARHAPIARCDAKQIVVSTDDRKSGEALARHMRRMRDLYGDVLPLSLVDQHVS